MSSPANTCPAAPPALNAASDCCGRLHAAGSTCSYHCQGGYHHPGATDTPLTCLTNGSWSALPLHCLGESSHSTPHSPASLTGRGAPCRRTASVSRLTQLSGDVMCVYFSKMFLQAEDCVTAVSEVTCPAPPIVTSALLDPD